MPQTHNFEHLLLVRRFEGDAILRGGPDPSPQTIVNRQLRGEHSATLADSAKAFTSSWEKRRSERSAAGDPLPPVPASVPLLLRVDPSLDVDDLRHYFDFEIVSEQEDGYVIVASEDINLATFRDSVGKFAVNVRGSATVASVHELFADPDQSDRLGRILSEQLMEAWGSIDDAQHYIVDLGISCVGAEVIPPKPKRGKTFTDAKWAARQLAWNNSRAAAYDAWEMLQVERVLALDKFVVAYAA